MIINVGGFKQFEPYTKIRVLVSQQCTWIQEEEWCSKSLAVNFLYHLGLDISQCAAKWLQGEGIARKITDEVDRVVSKLKKYWRIIRSTSKIEYSFSQHIFPAQSHQEKKSHHSVSMMRHHPLPYQNVLASNSAGCDGRRTVHIQFATCQPNFFRQVHLSSDWHDITTCPSRICLKNLPSWSLPRRQKKATKLRLPRTKMWAVDAWRLLIPHYCRWKWSTVSERRTPIN